MSKRKLSKQSGVSLIELIIYIAIFAVAAVSITALVTMIVKHEASIVSKRDTNADFRFAMTKLETTIQEATDVTTPADNTSGNTLTLVMSDAGENPTVFEVDNDRLQLTSGVNPSEYITSENTTVSNLEFTQVNNTGASPTVEIDLTVEYNSSGNPNEEASVSGTTTVKLRNN